MRLAIVVPCYNEEKVISESARRLTNILHTLITNKKIEDNSFILFVNDGSKDNTWPMIEDLYTKDKHIFGLCLALNRGHQNALLAGLMCAKDICDAAISIDADLQDDVNCIRIHGRRLPARIRYQSMAYAALEKAVTFFKRTTALAFYRLMSWLGAKSVYNHADYRLMSRRALQHLALYPERNLFLRGIISHHRIQIDLCLLQTKRAICRRVEIPVTQND